MVALCCVAVLAIVLASYLAVSNLSMKVSNRAYAKDVSTHLAEMGLERALRSFNADTFGAWTLSGVTARPASALTISSAHYGTSGQAITAAIKIRVDHYRATNKAVAWSPVITYAVGDFVWYQGLWYLCTAAPSSNQNPANTAYWKSAPEPWNAEANYPVDAITLAGGTAYRCLAANKNRTPLDAANSIYWSGYTVAAWNALTSYAINNLVFAGGASYRCLAANTNKPPTDPSNSGYWLRTGFSVSAWNAGSAYAIDDVALSGGTAYRCLVAHSNHTPPNTTYWLSSPVIYAEGIATLPDGSAAIRTQLLALIAPAPLFPNAAGATTDVNLSAGGTVDSYNSVLGTYNQTGSPFSVASPNLGSSAVLAGGDTTGTAVALTSTRVNGYVAAPPASTSPYNPLWSYGGSAILTATAAPTIPSPRLDLTRVSRSPNIPQFDILSVNPTTINSLTVPSGSTNLPRGGDLINASDGKYYYYTSGSLYLDSGYTLTITAPVVIDVRPASTTSLLIQGTGKLIIVNNPSASLEIHFGDELFVGSNGGGGIDNQTLDPKRCILLGTSTYNSSAYHYFWSSLPFYGVIYMPEAYLHVWNSGYTEHIYGALSAKNIYFNHVANLHYDTSLRTATISGVDAPYLISSWRELTDRTEQVTLP